MQYAAALLALATAVSAQGASFAQKSAPGSPPSGCQTTYGGGVGTFTFNTYNISKSSKRELGDLIERQEPSCGSSVTLTLNNGNLLDQRGRTGYIASNYQYQFDGPPQAGYEYTTPFSICGNNSIALGGSTVFYNCNSGSFNNVYFFTSGQTIPPQCYQVNVIITACAYSGKPVTVASSLTDAVGESTDSQVASATTSAASTSAASSAASTTAASSGNMMVVTANPGTTSLAPASTPYPVAKNATSPAATGTAVVAPTTTAAKTSSFTGAADVLAVGQMFVGGIAAVAAFAML